MSVRFLRAALVALCGAVAVASAAVTPARAQVEVSIDLFYNDLAPHGRWIHHPRWGWVWFPLGVDPGWRPYTRGRWIWTVEHGWYWMAEEPYGWAVYHYGRWGYDPEFGWIWVPGRVWGPAWVAFRYSHDAVGWAPLPPDTLAYYAFSHQAHYTVLNAAYYQPRWIFVPTQHFVAPSLYVHVVPAARNPLFIARTVNVTNYVTVNNIVVNRSIAPDRIERATGQKLLAMRVNSVNDFRSATTHRGGEAPNVVNIYRPVVRVAPGAAPPAAALAKPDEKPKLVVNKNAVAPNEKRAAPMTTTPHGAIGPSEPGKPDKGPKLTTPGGPPAGPEVPKKLPGAPTAKTIPGSPPGDTGTPPAGPDAPKKPIVKKIPGTPDTGAPPAGPEAPKKPIVKTIPGTPDTGTPPSGPEAPKKPIVKTIPGGPPGSPNTGTPPGGPAGPGGPASPKVVPGTPTVKTIPGGPPAGPPAAKPSGPPQPPDATVQPPPDKKPPKKDEPPCGKPGQPPCPPR